MKEKEFRDFVNSDRMIEIQKRRYYNYFVRQGLIK